MNIKLCTMSQIETSDPTASPEPEDSFEELRLNHYQDYGPTLKRRGLFVPRSGIRTRKTRTFGDTCYVEVTSTNPNKPLEGPAVEIRMDSILKQIPTPTPTTEPQPTKLADNSGSEANFWKQWKKLSPSVNNSKKLEEGCGITLSNPRMYTRPSKKTLDMLTKNGQCIIRNFKVCHLDNGAVTFLGKMDIHGANLDELIHFYANETDGYGVKIYEDGKGRGIGFNRLVVVELKIRPDQIGCIPYHRFEELLRDYCATRAPQWQYVSYEKTTHIWTYRALPNTEIF